MASPTTVTDSAWYPDSGATDHITADLDNLQISHEYSGNDQVRVGNGMAIPILHIGDTSFITPSRLLHLRDVFHVPKMTKNLLSLARFTADNDAYFEFHPRYCVLKDRATKQELLHGTLVDGLYRLDVAPASPSLRTALTGERTTLTTWHHRLGHPSGARVSRVLSTFELPYFGTKVYFCEACQLGKSHKLPFYSSISKSTTLLELIHSDVWGPAPLP